MCIRDSFNAAACACGPFPSASRMCWSRKITGICRKVDPLPSPEKAKAARKPVRNAQKLPWSPSEGSAKITTASAAAMPAKDSMVTLAPPILSESRPPAHRMSAPTNGPIQA